MTTLVTGMAGARPSRRPATVIAVAILTLVVIAIAAVFAFQAAGYPPCELCREERLPFYAGLALAAGTIPVAERAPRSIAATMFATLLALFLLSAAFGTYHAGVEWGFWAGPTDCTGTPAAAASSTDFLRQLRTVHVVRCDSAALRILGVSLAGWNAVVSLVVAALAAIGMARVLRP